MTNAPLSQIESAAYKYSRARADLAELMQILQDQIAAIRRTHLSGIKSAVGKASKQHAELKALLDAHPESFEKPKSQVFHNIKVGYRKGSGGISFADPDQVVELIDKHLADLADTLVKTVRTPIKKALENLDVAQLKKIGCTVEGTADVAFIKPVDGEVEKAVNALLKDATDEAGKEAA